MFLRLPVTPLLILIGVNLLLSTGCNGKQGSSPVKSNITICAFVRNSMPHILEWIEFHRVQGVDKFLLYDDGSEDSTKLLKLIYTIGSSSVPTNTVEVFPSNPNRRNKSPDPVRQDHDRKQSLALNHCNKRSENRSAWVLMIDVDEFVYVPQANSSLWSYLQLHSNLTLATPDKDSRNIISGFQINAVRFGSNGRKTNPRGNLSLNPFTGKTVLLPSEYGAVPQPDFFMMMNPKRAPHPDLDTDYADLHKTICESTNFSYRCQHALGKSVWIPGRCLKAGIHWCEQFAFGYTKEVSVRDIRMDHYTFQSQQHIAELIPWMKNIKEQDYLQFDANWFSLKRDNTSTFVLPQLLSSLSELIIEQHSH